jgi:hypothetical protein
MKIKMGVRGNRIISARRESGSVFIEAAFGLALLMLILGGMIDFGTSMNEQSVMVDAARAGGLAASSIPYVESIDKLKASSDLSGVAVSVAETQLTQSGLDMTRYQISIRQSSISGVLGMRISIVRMAAGRFRFLPSFGYKSCVAADFMMAFQNNDSPVPVADYGPEPSC